MDRKFVHAGRHATYLTGLAATLITSVVLASGRAADAKPDPAAASGNTGPKRVIIELTAPPAVLAARARGVTGALASSQRSRVRQLILSLEQQHRQAKGMAMASANAAVHHEYALVFNGFAADLMPETIKALESDPDVGRVVSDSQVKASLDVSVPHVRAPEFWQATAFRGAGTTIAIIDTGVDYTHPDLGGCFGAGCKVAGGYDFVNGDGNPIDDQGHGTHVAATAAGNGLLLGVAPDANVLAYKVLDAYGSGWMSDIIAGIERATDPNGDASTSDHATVISMSLGGYGDENDPMSIAVDNATSAGVLSVIAAGNSGEFGHFTVGSPGTARTALTVGATDDADAIAFFSSRGPTFVDFLLKPEITAPGVEICAASLPGAFPGTECLDSRHASISGTSMATPHVAGAAALVRGTHPALTPSEVKAILQQASVPLGLDVVTGGAGRLDVRATADVTTVITPAPINLGVDRSSTGTWVQSVPVTLKNLGGVEKSYTLSIPSGAFPSGVTAAVSPNPVSVPADGSATVTLTVSVDNQVVPDSSAPPYLHAASLVATSGSEETAVLVAFAKQNPPTNDACADAKPIGGAPFSDQLDTSQATTEEGDPFTSCACGQNSHTVWYEFVAPASGTVTVDTIGSAYDTVLAAFTGSCGNLSAVACNDDTYGLQSEIIFAVTAGTRYLIEVSSYCDAPGGGLTFSLRSGGDPPPPSEVLIAGRRLIVRDKYLQPAGRQLTLVSNDGDQITAPAPGSLSDPTLMGAMLELFNPSTFEFDAFFLPPSGWKGLGEPAGSGGYRYQDRSQIAGPCTNVAILSGRSLRAVCRGDQIAFSLDEPAQGSLAVAFTSGFPGEGLRYCAAFGGRVQIDRPAASGQIGKFVASDAPAPQSCPIF